jgi:putative ABC transport system permease protein
MSLLPTRGEGWVDLVIVPNDPRPMIERPNANYRFVAPDFFKVAATPILKGRAFGDTERDPSRPMPALVSARLAALVWPGQDALGQRFTRGDENARPFEVVGIVADARLIALEQAPPSVVYVPYWARSAPKASLMLRTTAPASLVAAALRRAIASVDPEAAVGDVQSLDAVIDGSLASRRYEMKLFVAFGLVALTIAIVGVYGVTAYGVSRRRREMNIRVALGANRTDVVRLIVGQGTAPILAGSAAGGVIALAIGGIVASLLFDVRARDPLVIVTVITMVVVVAVLASVVAARQGLVIDPAAALREE